MTIYANRPARLLVFDTSFLLHRAHHAMRTTDLRTSDGIPSWALHGAFRIVAQLAAKHSPTHLLFAADPPGGCPARRELFPEYKTGRSAPDPDLAVQLEVFKDLTSKFPLPVVQVSGWEADDVVGTVTCHAAAAGWQVTVVSGDRDLYQLVSPTVSVDRPDGTVVTPEWLAAKYGVAPTRYVEYAALRGDPSDNIPGVAGIGEKKAAAVIAVCDDLAGLTETAAASAVGSALAARLTGSVDLIARNRKLAALNCHVDIDVAAAVSQGALPVDPSTVADVLQPWGLRAASAGLRTSIC